MARTHRVLIEFDGFGWEALRAEARRQNIMVEELIVHAAMYYLSDLDSGRVAARVLKEIDANHAEEGERGETGRRFGRSAPGEEDEPQEPPGT
jgi:hypothetical protein